MMIGLMCVSRNGTLYKPNGQKLFRLPTLLAFFIQKVQHKIATLTWK